ncbi:hypothetical protein ACDN41_25815 [Priestia aryabhattai]|uniref:HTH-like domain-containing protein n=1 Tax=Priestia aryabhattai TaxID=412384 RepID=UPI003531A041
MTVTDLGKILKDMYSRAPEGYRVAHIHLFGIKYASIILKNELNVNEIISVSGLNSSYSTEVNKGIKLSRYVKLKSQDNE